jgi:predicted Rossmann fold nucleotide-binding protein DprA/Smf involved in DNA uptake
MARRADASLAAILLTQRLVHATGEPFRARDYWSLLERVGDPGQLLGRSADELTQLLDDATLATRIVGRFDAATSIAFELEKLEQAGIRVVTSVDADYPARFRDRLGSAAPPVLHVVGPIDVFDGPGLGVIGSREPSDESVNVAKDAARHAVERGWSIISGGSPGVDRCAMDAALEADGRGGVLLADSLLRVTREPEIRVAVGKGRLCLATPYPPAAGYSVLNAKGRNKLIYAASDTTLVVAADGDNDTTLAGATEALERGYGDVAVWTGPGAVPSNSVIAQAGGLAIEDLDELRAPGNGLPDTGLPIRH